MTPNNLLSPDFGTKQERCESLGKYIIANNGTVREAAKVFGISKSTVHTVVANW